MLFYYCKYTSTFTTTFTVMEIKSNFIGVNVIPPAQNQWKWEKK